MLAWIGLRVGKLADSVYPVTYALPEESTTMLLPGSYGYRPGTWKRPKPSPAGFSLDTNAFCAPAKLAWKGLTVGKVPEEVYPVTYALPAESTAMECPTSYSLPPKKVE